MQVVCESTQSAHSEVQVAGYECLVKIMQLYYDKMRFYMEKALFGVSPASEAREPRESKGSKGASETPRRRASETGTGTSMMIAARQRG